MNEYKTLTELAAVVNRQPTRYEAALIDEIERLRKLLQKIMARCADLLDEDQFNELDAMVTGQPSREIIQQAKECGCGICDACVAVSRPR